MQALKQIETFASLNLLAAPQRLAILRLLMVKAATLSQLSQSLNTYPAKLRHHVKKLENAGFIMLVETRVVGGYVEKYYRATAKAFTINLAIIPESATGEMLILSGSHDLAIETLADDLMANKNMPSLALLPIGSLDGLIALRQGVCHLAGAHLIDANGIEYNHSFVRHLFPSLPMQLVTVAYREQGLLTAPGNPLQISTLPDLARPDVRFVNRGAGTGTRLWLDQHLPDFELTPGIIQGYEDCLDTHHQVATAVALGQADVGLAVRAVAQQHGLGFIPLFEERYDLVLSQAALHDPQLQPVLDYLQTAVFRQKVNALNGYDTTHTGAIKNVSS